MQNTDFEKMRIVTTITDLRGQIKQWQQTGESIALVPTMGNLHEGHQQLVRTARKTADRVVVSIFVNPTQFGEGEDFAAYPRTEREDWEKLHENTVDLLFLPAVQEIYPPGCNTFITVNGISDLHCGASRLGHFSGVATIVCKLFNMVLPDFALFGEKDWQQLAVIRCMVRDLNIPVAIVAVPTVREADGLAMSSRNAYLTPAQRRRAPKLYQSLLDAREMLVSGAMDFPVIEQQQVQFLAEAGFQPDYFSICFADNLLPAARFDRDLVILVAAKLGKARLIDNVQVKKSSGD